jgi:hypothetical protein
MSPFGLAVRIVILILRVALVAALAVSGACGGAPAVGPVIEFTLVPPGTEGGPDTLATIAGRVRGGRPGQRIVLFAKSGVWWVQPLSTDPFTAIQADASWKSQTHLGFEYAALLVERSYRPPVTLDALPQPTGSILAVAAVKGTPKPDAPAKKIQFSGYDWEARQTVSERGGTFNVYDPANAWTDRDGCLHLRIAPQTPEREGAPPWSSAELTLTRSLGYGTYIFVVRNTAHLEPAAVFSVFTWDPSGTDPSHREMDIELTQWGDPTSKNAQFVVQPYYVPANVARFVVPAGVLTHMFTWEPGRVVFKTLRGAHPAPGARPIAEHEFTTGVPSPGTETIRMNLYVFGHTKHPLRHGAEVVIEKFVYLP